MEPYIPPSPQDLAALYARLARLEASEAITEEERDAAEAALHQRTDELVETSHRLATLVQRYHALFALAPDGYLVTDAAGGHCRSQPGRHPPPGQSPGGTARQATPRLCGTG